MRPYGIAAVANLGRREGSTTKRVQPWRAWFKSPTWKAIKRHRLMQEPNCRYCAQEGCAVIATHVGHVDSHRGQWSRFIQYENTQSLCARHHRQLKKRASYYCDS